jgi:hypothetical protein
VSEVCARVNPVIARPKAEAIPRRAFAIEPCRLLCVGLTLLCSTACRNDWSTDLWYQPSVRPQEVPPRLEPEHSVAVGTIRRSVDRDEADDLMKNPISAEPVSILRGSIIFQDRCAPCHGATGHGGGPVSRFFPPAPDLAYAAVKARSDGYIYGTIEFGGRAMPPLADGLTARDRWDLVNFVRGVQSAPPPEVKP